MYSVFFYEHTIETNLQHFVLYFVLEFKYKVEIKSCNKYSVYSTVPLLRLKNQPLALPMGKTTKSKTCQLATNYLWIVYYNIKIKLVKESAYTLNLDIRQMLTLSLDLVGQIIGWC